MNLDLANMNTTFKAGWAEAAYILWMANGSYPTFSAYSSSIPGHINFYLQNINKTRAELDNLILARYNSVTGGSLTLDQFKTQYNNRVAAYATCSVCNQGFYLDTTCKRCPPGCSACSSSSVCTNC